MRTGRSITHGLIRRALRRLSGVRRDVEHGLALTLDHFNTRPLQERALEIVRFKLDVLWSMLDAIEVSYPDEVEAAKGARHG